MKYSQFEREKTKEVGNSEKCDHFDTRENCFVTKDPQFRTKRISFRFSLSLKSVAAAGPNFPLFSTPYALTQYNKNLLFNPNPP